MSAGDSQDHSTVPPTLEGRTTQPEDPTNFVLQLQNDFAVLRYLLYPSVGTTPISDTSVKNSTISPPTILNPNPNPNHYPPSNIFSISCANEKPVRRSARRALLDHPERKQTTRQTPTFSFHPTQGKPLQRRRRTSHQEIPNMKFFSQTK